jgi:hypothetical protein
MKNIVGYGEEVREYVIKEKWDKRQVKRTQIIKRITEKTYLLACGHEEGMHLRPATVRVGCYKCWRIERGL